MTSSSAGDHTRRGEASCGTVVTSYSRRRSSSSTVTMLPPVAAGMGDTPGVVTASTDGDRTAGSDRTPGEDRVFTVPNLLSVVRLACVPLFLWLLFAQDDRLEAAALLGALGATESVDGYVARGWNQVSDVGKLLDPSADRIMLMVSIVAILVDGSVPTWAAIVTIVREVLVAATTLGIAALGARRIDV